MKPGFRRAEIDPFTVWVTLFLIVTLGLLLSAIMSGLALLPAQVKLSRELRAETSQPSTTGTQLLVQRAIVERMPAGIQVTLFVTNNSASGVNVLAHDLAAMISSANICSITSPSGIRWYLRSPHADTATDSSRSASTRLDVLEFPADTSTRASVMLEPSIRPVSLGNDPRPREPAAPIIFSVFASIPGIQAATFEPEGVTFNGSCPCELIGLDELLEASAK